MPSTPKKAESAVIRIREATAKLKAANDQFARDFAAAHKRFNDAYARLRKILDARKLENIKTSLTSLKKPKS